MGLKTTLDLAHRRLDQLGVPHALIGGMALSLWGAQRSTADVDFLVDGRHRKQAAEGLVALGFVPFYDSAEVLQFSGIGQLDLLFANRPLSLRMLSEAKDFPQFGIRCVKPEALIGLKIQAYKNNPKRVLQDKADIQRLMESNNSLDFTLIKSYASHFAEEQEMEQMWNLANAPK